MSWRFAIAADDRAGRHEQQRLEEGVGHQVEECPSVTWHIADPEKQIWSDYRRGFRGAICSARLVFYDPASGQFSSDSIVRYVGTCSEANTDGELTVVPSQSRNNLARKYLPMFPIQPRCPKFFPATEAQKAEANNPASRYYACGVTDPTKISCNFLADGCAANNNSNRRGSITWTPVTGAHVRPYETGKWIDVRNNANETKWGDFVPLKYGRGWGDPLVMHAVGDGNLTKFEMVLCYGQLPTDDASTGAMKIIANDVTLSPAGYLYGGSWHPFVNTRNEIRWNWIADGGRDGSPNVDTPYNGQGDPYGSMAAIMGVLPGKSQDPSSLPTVRALFGSPKIRWYSDPGHVRV